jgi:hypothetical protein
LPFASRASFARTSAVLGQTLVLLALAGVRSTLLADCPLPIHTTTLTTADAKSLSLAYAMTEKQYEESKKGGGAKLAIPGIEVSGNYDEFRKNVRERAESLGIQRFEQHYLAYATSGLDDTGLQAYKACLESQEGLYLVDERNSDSSYTLSLLYRALPVVIPGLKAQLGTPVNVRADNLDDLKAQIAAADFSTSVRLELTVIPKDPKREASVQVRLASNLSRSIRLPPLQWDGPPPPRPLYQTTIRARDYFPPLTTGVVVGEPTYGPDVLLGAPIPAGAKDLRFAAGYEVRVPVAGVYTLRVRYAGMQDRSPTVIVNNLDIGGSLALPGNTGGWGENNRAWSSEREINLNQGRNTLQFLRDAPNGNPGNGFPHLWEIEIKEKR